MRPSKSANLALALANTGWLVGGFGFLSQGGDPPPSIPDSVIERHRDIAIALLLVGGVCVLASLWFAGRSYPEAKVRSLLALGLAVVPAIAAIVSLY
jgi:hypothetical protein